MQVARLRLRDFRGYAAAEVRLGPGLTVVHGRNGAGKTNLLEALYFGCTGRSCRTSNERELVRFGAQAARVEVQTQDPEGRAHELAVGFQPGEPKRMRVDGADVERLSDASARPLVSVFLPDRLELVKGPPALRRSHLDQVVAAIWPARAGLAPRVLAGAGPAQRAPGPDPLRPRVAGVAAGVGRGARAPRHRAARRPRRDGGAARRALHGGRGRAGPDRGGHAALPPAEHRAGRRDARRRARRAGRGRPRARLHRPWPAPRRPRPGPRRPRAARLRLAGRAAHGPAGAAPGRARRPRRRARRTAPAAARRRHERARQRPPRAAGRAARRARAGARDDDRPRARSRARTRRT